MRHISMIGEICIVKTLANPNIIYQATVLPITIKIIKEMKKWILILYGIVVN